MSSARSKSPGAVPRSQRRPVMVADEGINPYQAVPTAQDWEAVIEAGRERVVEQLERRVSVGGRQVSVVFLEQMADGPTMVDKFRLTALNSGTGGLLPEQHQALDRFGAYRVEKLSGGQFAFIFIKQSTYEKRTCCGAFDLTHVQIAGVLLLNVLGVALIAWAVGQNETLQQWSPRAANATVGYLLWGPLWDT